MPKVNLGKKWDSSMPMPAKAESKVTYPTIYLDNVKGLELETGEIEFKAKGKVTSATERDDGTYSCTIELHEIDCEGCESEGLDGALKKIESKKMEMEDESEGGEE